MAWRQARTCNMNKIGIHVHGLYKDVRVLAKINMRTKKYQSAGYVFCIYMA